MMMTLPSRHVVLCSVVQLPQLQSSPPSPICYGGFVMVTLSNLRFERLQPRLLPVTTQMAPVDFQPLTSITIVVVAVLMFFCSRLIPPIKPATLLPHPLHTSALPLPKVSVSLSKT
ncbi:unnamed protein product [Soboliphyme baturini]|uniref:Secreted protein n=1 Tax=Soboliphyme baturini TaxID=241478 RepID=A0A183J7W8_9BILA|nr:unnamed protein product [Soboliphyme baturini]